MRLLALNRWIFYLFYNEMFLMFHTEYDIRGKLFGIHIIYNIRWSYLCRDTMNSWYTPSVNKARMQIWSGDDSMLRQTPLLLQKAWNMEHVSSSFSLCLLCGNFKFYRRYKDFPEILFDSSFNGSYDVNQNWRSIGDISIGPKWVIVLYFWIKCLCLYLIFLFMCFKWLNNNPIFLTFF